MRTLQFALGQSGARSRQITFHLPGSGVVVDNVRLFGGIRVGQLAGPVPATACQGWSIEGAINHLSFGVGRAYPVAFGRSPLGNHIKW